MKEIDDEEYNRITGEMEDLRNQSAGVTQAAMIRQNTFDRVQEIAEALRSMDGMQAFDEDLFRYAGRAHWASP